MAKKKNQNTFKIAIISIISLSGFCFIIIASFWWFELRDDTKIDIKFSETEVLTLDAYESLISEFIDDTITRGTINEITRSIEGHPYVKAARVSRHYPSQIRIEVIEREPIAIVNKNPMVLLDKDGFVLPDLGNINKYNLPIMSNFNAEAELYPHGQRAISVKVVECISLLAQLKDQYDALYNNLSEIKMSSSNEVELILADQPTHIFLGSKNIKSRIKILKEFENELQPNSISSFSYLDIRYDNQVIAKRRHS
jgi:cell division septal protein FtsQ